MIANSWHAGLNAIRHWLRKESLYSLHGPYFYAYHLAINNFLFSEVSLSVPNLPKIQDNKARIYYALYLSTCDFQKAGKVLLIGTEKVKDVLNLNHQLEIFQFEIDVDCSESSLKQTQNFDVIICSLSDAPISGIQYLFKLIQSANYPVVLILSDIYKSVLNTKYWNALRSLEKVKASVDLYHHGIIFTNLSQLSMKQDFVWSYPG